MTLEYKPKGKRDIGRPKTKWSYQQHLQGSVLTGQDSGVLHLFTFLMIMIMMMIKWEWMCLTHVFSTLRASFLHLKVPVEISDKLRSLLFWYVTQRRLLASYRFFGTTFRSHLQGWSSQSIVCTETSVTNYQSMLRNIPEEQSSHLHRDGSLKSRMVIYLFNLLTRWLWDWLARYCGQLA